jgi:predicted GIY-YIG superfamily endonuclease
VSSTYLSGSFEDRLQRHQQATRRPTPKWEHLEPLAWGGFLLRPSARRRPRDEEAPPSPAVYSLLAEDGRPLYIGQSSDLALRMMAHRHSVPDFTGYLFVPVPEHMLWAVETAHIHALEPETNKRYDPPKWAAHADMVQALRQIWAAP